MDANEYRLLKSEKNILDFATIKETERCLLEMGNEQLAQSITQLLSNSGIDKPVYHDKTGEMQADYYRVDLPATDIEVIVSMFLDKEIGALTTNFETTPSASYYASLLDRWNELIVQ